MSHVTIINVQIQDLEIVKAICPKLNLEFRENQTTYRWYGRFMGDYPMPPGMQKQDLGKCDHALAVRGKPQAYEVGLCRRGNFFQPAWDFWAGGYGLEEAIGKDGQKLIDAYAEEAALRKAQKLLVGWTHQRTYNPQTEDIILTFRQY